MGQNFNSKYKSSQDKTMLGRYKVYDSRENCIFIYLIFIIDPGPGQYTAFSEFGIYESKYAHTSPDNGGSNENTKQDTDENQQTSQEQTKPTEEKKPVQKKEPKKLFPYGKVLKGFLKRKWNTAL